MWYGEPGRQPIHNPKIAFFPKAYPAALNWLNIALVEFGLIPLQGDLLRPFTNKKRLVSWFAGCFEKQLREENLQSP